MSVLSLSKRLLNLNGHRLMPIIYPTANINTTKICYGTHNYDAIEFHLSKDKLQHLATDSDPLDNIRQSTGAVVRLKEAETVISTEGTCPLLVIGSNSQTRRAVDLLKQFENNIPLKEDGIVHHNSSNKLIWHGYKRNFKGQYAPAKPRKKCIRCGGKMLSGNPCPLCQMKLKADYTVHYTDTELLEQFICPHSWEILQPSVTGLCRMQQRIVEAAIQKARLYGYLPFTLPLPSDEPKKHKPAGVPTDKKIKVKMH